MHSSASLKTNYVKDYIFKLTVSFGNCLHVVTKDTITACLAYKKECRLRIMMNHCNDCYSKRACARQWKVKKKSIKIPSPLFCPLSLRASLAGRGFREQKLAFRLPHSSSLEAPLAHCSLFFFPSEVGKVNTLVARGRRLSGGL